MAFLPASPGRRRARLSVVIALGACAAALAVPAVKAAPRQAPAPRSTTWQVAATDHLARQYGIGRAQAAQRLQAQQRMSATSDRLGRALGARMAGSRIDTRTGQLVVSVLDQAAAQQVRAAGARAQVVGASLQRLRRAKAALDRTTAAPGMAWRIDPAAGSLVVEVPNGTGGTRVATWMRHARATGVPVTVQHTVGVVRTQAFFGGDAILNSGSRCSAGFNAQSGGTRFVLTAGHCAALEGTWTTSGGQEVGPSDQSSFPGNDFGAIRVTDPTGLDQQGAVLDNGSPQPITGVGRVPVNSTVCKTGSTTGTTCGTVQAYDVTVQYAEGTVDGLTQTDVCTQPGDSGGSLFADSQAQGVTSGGTTGGCDTAGFQSFFQPADEALSSLGLSLL